MFNAMKAEYANADIVIMAAAVADYAIANQKMKRSKERSVIGDQASKNKRYSKA